MKEQRFDFWSYVDGTVDGIAEILKVVNADNQLRCKHCGSIHVVRYGHSKHRQRLLCQDCKHTFMDSDTLPGMKVSPQVTAAAVGMFYEGMSLNAIRRQLQQQYSVYPSDSTVYGWIQRYTQSAVNKADTHKPQVGEVWVADETVIKVNGKNTWFWDIIDAKTRFLLASRISATRKARDAYALMITASQRAGKTPKVVITDKLLSYLDGVELAFGGDTKHIPAKRLTSTPGTQLIERFHGSLKDRTKVMRGLKSRESADLILAGWLVHYNFFRPHETLGDSTPAQKAGIKFDYRNWLDVVKASAKPTIAVKARPALELHHPSVSLSASDTLGHFAGHKLRITPPMPRITPKEVRLE